MNSEAGGGSAFTLGGEPVSSSNVMTPSDHRSRRTESAAMAGLAGQYGVASPGDGQTEPTPGAGTPHSTTFTPPPGVTQTLSGGRKPWGRPRSGAPPARLATAAARAKRAPLPRRS